MRILLLCLCVVLLTVNIQAQKKKTSPPKAEIIQRLEPEGILKSDGFNITFPSKPTRTVSTINPGFGKTNVVNFKLSTTLAYYNVNYFDFPTIISDPEEIAIRLNNVKEAVVNNPANRLLDEKEIIFGDNQGMEFTFENQDATVTYRAFIIKQRFFALVVGTNGRTSKLSEKVKQFNRQKVEKFYNSFVVTELPEVKSEAIQLPADFGISITDSTFSTKFFGVSMKLPLDWKIVNKEEEAVIKELSVQSEENSTNKNRKALEFSLNNTEILLFMTKSDFTTTANESVLVIAAEKISFPKLTPLSLAETYIKTGKDATAKVIKSPFLVKVDGVDFAVLETEDQTNKLKHRLFFANLKGIAFEMIIIYRTQDDLKTILDAIQTLRFSEELKK